ncbi:hypothetical protein AB0M91_18595 [Micromonospora rifamycinica]
MAVFDVQYPGRRDRHREPPAGSFGVRASGGTADGIGTSMPGTIVAGGA